MLKNCDGLRILLVGPYPPPFGGIASHLTMLIPGLIQRGAEDICVLSSTSGEDSVEHINGASIIRLNVKRHVYRLLAPQHWPIVLSTLREYAKMKLGWRRLLFAMTQAMIVDEIARRYRSDVVSFYQSDNSFGLLPCSRIWGKKRGIVLTVFGECYDSPGLFESCTGFAKQIIDRPNAVVSSSRHCARSFTRFGSDREIEPVYYGIDLARFSNPELREPYRTKLSILSNELLITYMGRFNEEMGIGRLLKIGPSILSRLPNAKLLLAGASGPLNADAAVFAAQYPDRVYIQHDIPFDLQPSIYAATDILLAPSADQHACMGMSIKEAMAASLPVIGSKSGGVPEAIVDGVTGILVPLDSSKNVDVDSMLDSIQMLAKSPELRKSMGEAARRRAEDIFTTERTINRMADLFLKATPCR